MVKKWMYKAIQPGDLWYRYSHERKEVGTEQMHASRCINKEIYLSNIIKKNFTQISR